MGEEKKNINWKNIIAYSIVVIVILLIGFFAGKFTTSIKVKIETEYIQLPPIHDTVIKPAPASVRPPIDTAKIIQSCINSGLYSELFPYKEGSSDTTYTSKDTAQIMYDWATTRTYSETLFDIDTVGKCDLAITIQYNRIDTIEYTYIPIQKQTTITKERISLVKPFIGGGVSIAGDANKRLTPGFDAQLGLFIKEKYGLSLQYQYLFGDIQNHVVSAQFLYLF